MRFIHSFNSHNRAFSRTISNGPVIRRCADPSNRLGSAATAGRLRENTMMRRPIGGAEKPPYFAKTPVRDNQAAFFSAFRHLVQRSSLLVNFL
jgi:hypothetical protein